jgi:hypothetical protein
MSIRPTRRSFVVLLSSMLLASVPRSLRAVVRRHGGPHPVPRLGIDASKVLPDSELADWPDARPAFAAVREIPQVVDGIRCNCGCADQPGFYSLLSCYEGDGMARHCPICQGQARLALRLHQAGKSLDEIRAAVDARYG